MKIEAQGNAIQQASQEMFRVIEQAQQINQDMANKMIKLSIEQQVQKQKTQLTNQLVDMYL